MTPDSPTLTRVVLESELPDFIASLPPDLSARIVLCAKDDDGLYYNVRLEELTQARAELARRAEPVAWMMTADQYGRPAEFYREPPSFVPPICKLTPLYAAAPPVSAGDGREACCAAWTQKHTNIFSGGPIEIAEIFNRGEWGAADYLEGWQAALAWQEKSK